MYFGKIADIFGVVGKDGAHCFWDTLVGFDDYFIGEKFTHGLFPSRAA